MQGYHGFQIMIRPEEILAVGFILIGVVVWFVVRRVVSNARPERP